MSDPKKKPASTTRRSFIKTGAMASSIFIVPRHVLGGVGFTSPSDQLNIAAIGAGGKGSSDIKNASVNGRERIVALCDVDFSGSAKKSIKQFPKAKLYADCLEKSTGQRPIIFYTNAYQTYLWDDLNGESAPEGGAIFSTMGVLRGTFGSK